MNAVSILKLTAKSRQEPAQNKAHKRFTQDSKLRFATRKTPSTSNKRTSQNGIRSKRGGGGVTPHGVFNPLRARGRPRRV